VPRKTSTMSRQRNVSILSLASSMNSRSRQSSQTFGLRQSRRSSLAEFEALAHLPVNYAAAAADNAIITKMEEPTPGLPHLSTSQAFSTRTTLSLLAWSFFSCFAYINYTVHLPAFAASVGLSSGVGAGALSLTGLTMLLGNITLGRVTDIVGPIRILQITMMLLMVISFVWPYITDATGVTILAGLFGYAATTQGSVPLIIMADAFGSSSPDSILTLLGILNFAKFPGYLFGPTICGSLYERDGDYFSASVFTGVIMLIG
jgi:predicted MFS family arabinose efflux permease